jgi:hypothetical protein
MMVTLDGAAVDAAAASDADVADADAVENVPLAGTDMVHAGSVMAL